MSVRRLRLFHTIDEERGDEVAGLLAQGEGVGCLVAVGQVDPRVTVLGREAWLDYGEALGVEGVLDRVDRVGAELAALRPGLFGALASFAGGREEAERYVRRWLMRTVADLVALEALAARFPECPVVLDPRWPGGASIAFVASVSGGDAPVRFAAPRRGFVQRLARASRASAALWREVAGRLGRPGRRVRRPLLLRHYGEDWGTDRGGQRRLRNFDFLVDGSSIRPDEVAILAEDTVPVAEDARLESRGYLVLRRERLRVGPGSIVRILPDLWRGTLLLVRAAWSDDWWLEPARTLVVESLLWREVGRRHGVRAFVAYNDLHPVGLARTLGLRRAGCASVAYEFSSSWLFDERSWLPDFVYANTVVDGMVTWGPLHSDQLRRHRALLGEIWETGCLWSEHARLVREDARLRAHYRDAAGLGSEGSGPIVAVFDSSPDPQLLSPDDLAAFHAGISELAARLPHVRFLVKPKLPLPAPLPAAPNLVVLPNLFETAAAIALSDATISACFTSTAIETIGAGSPAIYFDATTRFPNAFFREIDGLVADDVDGLEALLRDRLAGKSGLDRLAVLEGRLDGLALTRFRERLRALLDA